LGANTHRLVEENGRLLRSEAEAAALLVPAVRKLQPLQIMRRDLDRLTAF
jgi:hypothetical protein